VFGTVVDWRSSLIDMAGATGAGEGMQAEWAPVVDDWRRAYQPALDGLVDTGGLDQLARALDS
jgi:2-haloacid dehalogenase